MFFSKRLCSSNILAPYVVVDGEACSGKVAPPAILTQPGEHQAGGNDGFDFFDGPGPKRPCLESVSLSRGLLASASSAAKTRSSEPPTLPDINDIWDRVPRDVWGLILGRVRQKEAASLASVRRGPHEAFVDPAALHQQWRFGLTNLEMSLGENELDRLEFFREPRNQAILSFTPSIALGGPKWLRPDLPKLYDILAAGTPRLKRLSLHTCYHLSPRDHHPIRRLTGLTRLEIPGTARHLDDDLMSVIGTMTGLRWLHLNNESKKYYKSEDFINPDDARRSVITAAGVARLKGLTRLEDLDLSGHFLPASCTRLLLGLNSLRSLDAFHWQGFTTHQVQSFLNQMPTLSWFNCSMLFSKREDLSAIFYAQVRIRDRRLKWYDKPYKRYGMRTSGIKKIELSFANVEDGDDPTLIDRMSASDVPAQPRT
jgi:hypothetical protein